MIEIDVFHAFLLGMLFILAIQSLLKIRAERSMGALPSYTDMINQRMERNARFRSLRSDLLSGKNRPYMDFAEPQVSRDGNVIEVDFKAPKKPRF